MEISLRRYWKADGLINILTQSGILKPKDANTPAPSSASATDPQKTGTGKSGTVYEDLPVLFP